MEAPPSPSPASPATNGGEDCCVKVAVHIRPLIADERAQGCKDCVTVVSGKPQSFEIWVLVDNWFLKYIIRLTQLAEIVEIEFIVKDSNFLWNFHTGSGKTYTLGTVLQRWFPDWELFPQVMNVLFRKIETLKHQTEFQLHVLFIEGRSHGIFTITLEQLRQAQSRFSLAIANPNDSMNEDYLCAKLHLVDLAGSERAKRTGVHINKGLSALGNVISAIDDERKANRRCSCYQIETVNLTRILQTNQIRLVVKNSQKNTCISPADINAEENLNTLKYANRARNIQNKPVVNRDPMSSEMLKMRQQLEYLQAELFARGGGCSSDEIQVLKERIAWLEAANEDLCRELHEYRSRCTTVEQRETDAQDGSICSVKTDGLKRSLHSIESPDYQMGETIPGDSREIDEEVAKEWEHTLLQNTMDKELHELNRRLEEKESEMILFGGADTAALTQHFGKKIIELEDEKRAVQVRERDRLLAEIENLSASSDQKLQDIHYQKLKTLDHSKNKKVIEASKRVQDEFQYIKAQKTEEAANGLPRNLKELLGARKSSARDNSAISNVNGANGQSNEKSVLRWLDQELEVRLIFSSKRIESSAKEKNGFASCFFYITKCENGQKIIT
ncbi:hypothetical protein NC653_032032 [Populus alba x Populus x berolinensis]|uniref:Kinesin-like protein n=1 Tax=Populus alba x Populus x berolinensis TaxID=444605 RepID=A0AAD6PZA0_9ROSI|nr:hypothetical protein NC653_032032 [Populus alba x Populus x berolinensis]